MPLSITDVITPTTAAEVEQEILDLCATGNLPTTAWQPGSVIRDVIGILAQEIATKSVVETEIAKGGFGDLGSPEWVKLWAQAIYNVLFVPAATATGSVTLTNASAFNYPLNPGDLIVANASTGHTYRNQAAITIPAHGSVDAAIASDLLGTAANAAPAAITTMVSALVGVTVTNALPVLGADEETAAALVLRTRAKLGSFSPNGPKGAYDFVATTPLGSFPAIAGSTLTATSTPITRSKTKADPATGLITVYLATASGPASGPDVGLVQLALDRWAEPWCIGATAAPAANLTIPVTYQVWIKSSLTEALIKATMATALATYFATVPIGGFTGAGAVAPNGALYVEELQAVIRAAFPVPGIQRVLVTLPAGDVTLTPDQVAVLGTVLGTVTFVP